MIPRALMAGVADNTGEARRPAAPGEPVSVPAVAPGGVRPAPREAAALLEYTFLNPALLELALTHPSITHDLGAVTPHNQRLEFLGDAVLQLVLTAELYQKFPALDEGLLTQARAEMVNRRTLASQSCALGLGACLRMSRSEESTGGRDRASALADAFEAVVGAIFVDGGLESARRFVLWRFRGVFGELEALPSLHNPKGELQELLQAASVEAPCYQLLSVSGPDHDRVFESAVSYRGAELGRGSGKTKKAAESEAAREALVHLRREAQTPSADPPAGPLSGAAPGIPPVR